MSDTLPEKPTENTPPDTLPRYLLSVWIVLTFYGSLYPFSDWQPGIDPFGWVSYHWPYYWTVFDLFINVLVYMPTGFLWALVLACLPKRFGKYAPLLLATFFGSLTSFTAESLQSWLPSRVASNLDWATNSLGTFLGALFVLLFGKHLGTCWRFCRQRLITSGQHADLGLTLLGLWLLTLLSPEILLFGVGDLRKSLDWLPTLNYDPETYLRTEAAVVTCNFLSVGFLSASVMQGRWLPFLLTPLFFLLSCLVRTLSAALLAGPENFLTWLTPGALQGLQLGILLLCLALFLPKFWQLFLAALMLLLGTILVNLAPVNPYSALAWYSWQQGHFLNFNGLTRWIATLWPFLALPYLFMAARRT